jgi:hypothetical protein
MDQTSQALKKETDKWLEKLERERSLVSSASDDKALRKAAESALKNMDAYMKDTRHFLQKGDFVRAFEAVIYAWGILETLERTGLIEKKK